MDSEKVTAPEVAQIAKWPPGGVVYKVSPRLQRVAKESEAILSRVCIVFVHKRDRVEPV